MTTELVTHDLPTAINTDRPMTVGELSKQAHLIQDILDTVMVDGIHYGVIPGTGDKKTLYQAGAEKICSTFRLAPKYTVEDLCEPSNNVYRYRVTCSLYYIHDGNFVGSAVGEASTLEEKYSWQVAVCEEQWEDTDPSKRRKKWQKDGSFIQQVARNAADLANTVLKIATKRAFVSATRGSTAASDLLEVDLDEESVADLARAQRGEESKAAEKPKAKAKAKAAPIPQLPYGNHKGKEITDPSVPLGDLEWMAQSMANSIDDPARAKFRAQNQLILAALDLEIATRKAPQPSKTDSSDAQTGRHGETPPMNDSAWADCVLSFEEQWAEGYKVAKRQFNVSSAHDIAPERRWEFFEAVQAAAKTQ